MLTALDLQLTEVGRALADPEGARRLTLAKGLVQTLFEDLRGLSHDLRPAALDLGLPAALRDLADSVSHPSLAIELVLPRTPQQLAPQLADAIFRIVQTALANVVQHAHASRVKVVLAISGDTLRLEIEDDGTGFEVDFRGPATGIGLIGMRERSAALGGTLAIKSAIGRGTAISLRFPLNVAITPPQGTSPAKSTHQG